MSIFKKKETIIVTPLELLQARSANAVSIIRNTINELKGANEAIDAEHQKNDEQIAYLTDTNASLDTLKGDNAKIITNFENLLS
jgi:hypothetical protein